MNTARRQTTARFTDERDARAALVELGDDEVHQSSNQVFVRSAHERTELHVRQGRLRRALFTGLIFGLLAGTITALLAISPIAELSSRDASVARVAPVAMDGGSVLFAFAAGFVLGGLAGSLFGTLNPQPMFTRLAKQAHHGPLILRVESEESTSQQTAERILREHSGDIRAPQDTARRHDGHE